MCVRRPGSHCRSVFGTDWLSLLPCVIRGSTGARSYELQRARDLSSGRWAVVRQGFHDCHLAEEGRALDASLMRTPPTNYFYRLVALNETGRSNPSPIFPLLLPSMDSASEGDPGTISKNLTCVDATALCRPTYH